MSRLGDKRVVTAAQGTRGGEVLSPKDQGKNLLLACLLVPAWGEGTLTGPAHRNKFHPVFRSLLLNTSIVLNDVFYFIRRFTLWLFSWVD